MKKLAIAGIVLLVLILLAGGYLWYMMQQPLYRPGMVRANMQFSAVTVSTEPDFWTVESNIRLFHRAEGAGRQVLVVHGGPGFPFRESPPGLKTLASGYRLIYYDQRGCGQSTRPIDRFYSSNFYANMKQLDASLGLGAQIADIERIRGTLGEEKLILLGHSFGAFIASLYAAEFPEHVRALVLVAPADILVLPVEGRDLLHDMQRLLPEDKKTEYADFLKRYMDFGQVFTRSEADLRTMNAEFGKYYRLAAAGRFAFPEGAVAPDNGGWMAQGMYMSMGRRHDYREALKKVAAPVLVIHGANDIQPVEGSRAYVSAFPNARMTIISGAGHFPFYDQPEAFASATSTFLGNVQ